MVNHEIGTVTVKIGDEESEKTASIIVDTSGSSIEAHAEIHSESSEDELIRFNGLHAFGNHLGMWREGYEGFDASVTVESIYLNW